MDMDIEQHRQEFNQRFAHLVHMHRGECTIQDSEGNYPMTTIGGKVVCGLDAVREYHLVKLAEVMEKCEAEIKGLELAEMNALDKYNDILKLVLGEVKTDAGFGDVAITFEEAKKAVVNKLSDIAEEAKREERNRIFEELHSLFMESNGFEDRTVKLHTYIYKQPREDY